MTNFNLLVGEQRDESTLARTSHPSDSDPEIIRTRSSVSYRSMLGICHGGRFACTLSTSAWFQAIVNWVYVYKCIVVSQRPGGGLVS